MRFAALVALSFSCLPAARAQSFVVPSGTVPSTGTCNVFPFGTTDMRYQALILAADLGSTAGVISGFALAPCSTGVRTMTGLTVKMAHYSGATMGTTFDTNLNSPGPVFTVLDTVNHKWVMVGNAWNEVGLQIPFVYNGVDNLVVDILVTGSAGVSGAMHREATHQRVYLGGYTGQLAGTNGGNTAFKMKVFLGEANTQLFGAGCTGSAGVPAFSFSGTAQIGTPLGLDCVNAPPGAPTLFLVGSANMLPVFPVDLTPLGATGCTLYHSIRFLVVVNADGSGHASLGLPLPADPSLIGTALYFSALVFDPLANPAAITASNYGRALLGT
jgi:hypothetical protein